MSPIRLLLQASLVATLNTPAAPAQVPSTESADPARSERSSSLLGQAVKGRDGESRGGIEDLIFNRSGRISYAVISPSRRLDEASKLFAIPWALFSAGMEGNAWILAMEKQKLDAAPGFDGRSWPDMSDPRWCDGVDHFYGLPEPADRTFGGRAGKLDDAAVKNSAGRKVGEVEEIIIDTGRGFATMVVVETEKDVVPKDRLVAIPWTAMSVHPKEETFTLNTSEAQLADAPGVTKDAWPVLDAAWTTTVYTHFGRNSDLDIPVRTDGSAERAPAPRREYCRTSALIGLICRGPGNEDLGRITEVILVQEAGRPAMLVIEAPTGDGLLRAVPATACRIEGASCVLATDLEKLRKAPSFPASKWPSADDLSWYDDACRYFGAGNGGR